MEDHTPTFLEAFKENPVWIFFGLLFGLIGLVLAAIAFALVKNRPSSGMRAAIGGLVLGVLAVFSGANGFLGQNARTAATLEAPGLSELDKQHLREFGNALARDNALAGSFLGLPALGLSAFIVMMVRARKTK